MLECLLWFLLEETGLDHRRSGMYTHYVHFALSLIPVWCWPAFTCFFLLLFFSPNCPGESSHTHSAADSTSDPLKKPTNKNKILWLRKSFPFILGDVILNLSWEICHVVVEWLALELVWTLVLHCWLFTWRMDVLSVCVFRSSEKQKRNTWSVH